MTTAVVGHFTLPDHFRGDAQQKKMIDQFINSRLDFPIEIDWKIPKMRAFIRRAPQFPATVLWKDHVKDIEDCSPGTVLIGVTERHKLYYGSFKLDDPHWAFSVQTGRGKSTFLCCTIAQIFHQDPEATATGIDPKMESFLALLGVPGFHIYNDPRDVESMWVGIRNVKKLMDERYDQRAEDPTVTFPRHLLVIDELTRFGSLTHSHWMKIKEKKDPVRAEVWDDFTSILLLGRAANINVLTCGQIIYDATLGNVPGIITSFGFKGLAGHRPRDWDRLVGTYPAPRPRKEKGRWVYTKGDGDDTWVQNLLATELELKDWAMSARSVDKSTGGVEWVVGLNQAAERTKMSYDAFRKMREREGGTLPGEQRRGNRPMWPAELLDNYAQKAENNA
jgi:hypothetical protein